jgi:hypothetical protein
VTSRENNMTYQEFNKQYPHLGTEDYEEYNLFLADRAATEAWHESLNPQRLKEFLKQHYLTGELKTSIHLLQN